MWLYTKRGFLSIVENFHNKDELLVRGRFKGDIEAHFPNARVLENAGTDYRYRTFLPKKVVAKRTQEYVESELNYSNFKSSVKNVEKHNTYLDVWVIMKQEQDRLEDEDASEAY